MPCKCGVPEEPVSLPNIRYSTPTIGIDRRSTSVGVGLFSVKHQCFALGPVAGIVHFFCDEDKLSLFGGVKFGSFF